MGLFYGNVALGGGGLVLVDSLPTANATEYNKHNLYLYNGEIYYITEDSGTYAYEKLPEKAPEPSVFNNIHIHNDGDGYIYYKLNDGAETKINEYQSVTLNDVSTLFVRTDSPGKLGPIYVGTTDGASDIHTFNQQQAYDGVDATEYLQDGCYIYAETSW